MGESMPSLSATHRGATLPGPPLGQVPPDAQAWAPFYSILGRIETFMERTQRAMDRLQQQADNNSPRAATSLPSSTHAPASTPPRTERHDETFMLEKFLKLRPPAFSGTTNPETAEHWVKQTKRILRTMGCPDHLKVSLATFKFEGEAVNWWETIKRAIPEGRAWHWEDFERRFFEKYFPRSYRDEKMSEFLKLTQGEMTIAQYESRFTELSRYAPKLVEDEDFKIKRFKDGLRPSIHSKICCLNLKSYANAIDKATRAENDDDRRSRARLQQHEAGKRLRTNPMMPPISNKRPRIVLQQAGTLEDKRPRDSCPGCGYCQKLGHDMKNCYKKMRDEGRPVPSQKQPFGPSAPQKSQGRLYAMRSPEDADTTSGLIEGTTTIRDTPVVLLFDCGATMSFISSSIVERLNLELKRTKETITVASPLGKVVELNKYCEGCPITIAGLVIPVNLVIINMKCFDVILGTD
ncbi:uncharacterized protein LOC131217349 [Magnolia sinica]|uniref:uncharacterized protein LOC131217349 n=1 Tax=Magnolia sinica TaxID=86752 RepID=UPI002657D7F7|nr:uncharacterized protein LOC131217349 [Magnolia sinica]